MKNYKSYVRPLLVIMATWHCVAFSFQANAAIEEIIVTATKREQSITDVGISVSVVNSDALQLRNMSNTSDLAILVPGFSAGETGYANPIYSLRGIGVNEATIASGSSVSIYVDEVPMTLPIMTRGANIDLQRVEVVKGPQGTLYGQNATGGAINYIAAKPTDAFEAGVQASYGRYDAYSIEGFVSGPLSDSLKGRLALRTDQSDAWQKSITRDEEIGEKDKFSGRGILEWEASDTFRAKLMVSGWQDKSDNLVPQLVEVAASNPAVGVYPEVANAPIPPNDPVYADWDPGENFAADDQFYQGSLRLDWDLSDNMTLTSITAYGDGEVDSYYELDGIGGFSPRSPTPGGGVNLVNGRMRADFESFTQELRLAWNVSDVNFVFGANYIKDESNENPLFFMYDFKILDNIAGMAFDEAQWFNEQDIESVGVFANVDFPVNDTFSISAGVRYNEEKRDFKGCTADSGDGIGAPVYNNLINILRGLAGVPPLTGDELIAPGECWSTNGLTPEFRYDSLDEENVPWHITLNYNPWDRTLFYASLSKGFKSGNFPSFSVASNDSYTPVVQEEVLAYEVGFKTSEMSWISAEGAIFRYDYTDKQQRGRLNTGFPWGLVGSQVNIPKSRVVGAEATVTVLPLDGLTVTLSGTYIDTEIREYEGFNIDGQFVDMSGHDLNLVPPWSANLDVNYTFPMTDQLNAFVGANVSYRDETSAQLAASDAWKIDEYTLVDAQLGVVADDETWRIWLWGKNISDEYYWSNVIKTGDSNTRFPGMGATYGVSFAYSFR